MRLTKAIILSVFLVILMQLPAFAGASAGIEWRYQDGEQSADNLTLNLEASDKWDIQASYNIDDEDLALDVLYKTKKRGKIQPYLGLGVRDLLQTSETDRSVPEKIEIVGGVSADLNKNLSMHVDLKVVPNNLFKDADDGRMDPRLSVGLSYRLPGRIFPRQDVMNAADYDLLARLVTAEAGSEPYDGQVAVAAVIFNRIKSYRFPNSVRDVIYQSGQFSSVPKLATTVPTETSRKAVLEAFQGKDPSHGALYFYNPKTCSRQGLAFFTSGKLRVTAKIGNHIFLVNR